MLFSTKAIPYQTFPNFRSEMHWHNTTKTQTAQSYKLGFLFVNFMRAGDTEEDFSSHQLSRLTDPRVFINRLVCSGGLFGGTAQPKRFKHYNVSMTTGQFCKYKVKTCLKTEKKLQNIPYILVGDLFIKRMIGK